MYPENTPHLQEFSVHQTSVKKIIFLASTMAHAYNPSYCRGRDWEDRGSRAALAKSL
jgi:hypothetical protein